MVLIYISSITFCRNILTDWQCPIWNKIATIICCISHNPAWWKRLKTFDKRPEIGAGTWKRRGRNLGAWRSESGRADPFCHILAVSWAGYSSLSFLSPSSVKWGVNTSIGCCEVEMREFMADLAQCLAGHNPQERVAVMLIKALLKGFPSPHPKAPLCCLMRLRAGVVSFLCLCWWAGPGVLSWLGPRAVQGD